MAAQPGTLATLARHLVVALTPLKTGVADEAAFRTLVARLAWDVTSLPPEFSALATKVDAAVTALEALADDPTLDEVFDLIDKAKAIYVALQNITTAPAGVDPVGFLEEIGLALIDLLLIDYLIDQFPNLYAGLRALGIITEEFTAATPERPSVIRSSIRWDEIPKIVSEPYSIPARLYGWGGDHFDAAPIARHLLQFFVAFGWPAYIGPLNDALGVGFLGATDAAKRFNWALKILAALDKIGDNEVEIGLALLELPAQDGKLPGLILQPLVPSGLGESYAITDNLHLELRAGSDVASTFGVLLRPPDDISVKYPFQDGANLPSAGFGAALTYQKSEPFHIFGTAKGIRLEGKAAKFPIDLDVKHGQLELKVAITPEDLTLVLAASDIDGFLGSVLGANETRIAFPLGLSWSNRTGLNFAAGLGFEVSAYPHLDLGFVRFDRIDLGVRAIAGGAPQLDVRVAAAFSGALGPIEYNVDRLGVHMPVTFEPGNAGPFDVDFGVLLPLGIGLVVDAGPLAGGGYIKRDPDAGRYVGMLELKMFDIGASAIGILDTKDAAGGNLPPPGYSFFIALSAEFEPIQLGYGFTLNGVGGLAGIHRRMNVDALRAGLREGTLDSVMFPKDPVANAAVIVSNLTTIFPIAMNRYVFGPMAIIGWPTPNLVTAELGVILEVPSPVLLALLGKAQIVIPAEDEPVIDVHVDFLGVLDYGRSLFSLDATLHNSHVAAFDIQGDMAMRLVWAGKRTLALAIGGLHPHFAPPPGFPSLRRVTVALGNGDNPRITLEGYYALTSNSRQVGARAELYAEAGGFAIQGWVGFDALFTVRPLWFRVDFEAGVTLKHGSRTVAGITVRGSLTGPAPFHVWGEGCLSLLFFDVCVPFDKTFGVPRLFDLPGKDPWPLLEAAIKAVENWASELGTGVAVAVSLRPTPTTAAPLLLHPMGAATLRQHTLPFNRLLERFGEFDIVGPNRYDIATVRIGDNDNTDWHVADDNFAPGDFEALSETDRLSRDSFESMAAGVRVGGDLVNAPQDLIKIAIVTYETRIVDAEWDVRVLPQFLLARAVQLLTTLRGAKASSGLYRSGRGKFARDAARPLGVVLKPETYAVATTDTLAQRADIGADATQSAAYLAIKSKIGGGARAKKLQVVPTHELEVAA